MKAFTITGALVDQEALPADWEEQKKVSSNYTQDFRVKHLYRKIQFHSLSIFGKRKLFP